MLAAHGAEHFCGVGIRAEGREECQVFRRCHAINLANCWFFARKICEIVKINQKRPLPEFEPRIDTDTGRGL